MPCFPGFLPVMNEVQAGGVSGGIADSNSPHTPLLVNFDRLGNRPSASHGPMRSQVAESKPNITIFGCSIFPIHFSARSGASARGTRSLSTPTRSPFNRVSFSRHTHVTEHAKIP